MNITNSQIFNDPESLGGKGSGIYMSITHQEIVTGIMTGHDLLVRNDAAARRDAAAAFRNSEANKILWSEIDRITARDNKAEKRKASEEPADGEAPSQRARRDEDAGPSQRLRPRRDAARRSERSESSKRTGA